MLNSLQIKNKIISHYVLSNICYLFSLNTFPDMFSKFKVSVSTYHMVCISFQNRLNLTDVKVIRVFCCCFLPKHLTREKYYLISYVYFKEKLGHQEFGLPSALHVKLLFLSSYYYEKDTLSKIQEPKCLFPGRVHSRIFDCSLSSSRPTCLHELGVEGRVEKEKGKEKRRGSREGREGREVRTKLPGQFSYPLKARHCIEIFFPENLTDCLNLEVIKTTSKKSLS